MIEIRIPFADRDWRDLTTAEFEAMRHAYEVKHCVERGYEFTKAHCAAIVATKGFERGRAEAIWRDATAAWKAIGEHAREELAA